MPGIETDSQDAPVPREPAKSLDEVAAETADLLGRAGVQLALAEACTGGEVGRRLAGTAEGRAVLTQRRVFGTPEELAEGLRVSPAKIGAFGAVSEMVAAEAATELIDTYEGGWGLVVLAEAGNPPAEPGVQSEGPRAAAGFIALGTPSTTVVEQCPANHLVSATFELLQQQALRRLKQA